MAFDASLISDMMLNENSKQDKEKGFKIYHIDIDEIRPNERNKGISMPGIEELAENIGIVGLEQNLVVSPKKDGMYNLQTGHRRLAALKMLVEQGREEFRSVPCIIFNPDSFQYKLSDENKDALIWVSSNVMTRKPTNQDLLKFVETLNEVYKDLKKNNPGISIGSKKEYVAKELKISPSQVQILNSIGSHLIEPAFNAFLDNKLSLIVAKDLARLSAKDQREFIAKHPNLSEITGLEITTFLREKNDAKERRQDNIQPYTHETYMQISEIVNSIGNLSEKTTLSPAKALKAQQLSNRICKELDELLRIFEKSNK